MQEQYRQINDRIHVSEELFQRTREAVRKEERRQKIRRLRTVWISAAAAACICLAGLAVWEYTGRDQLHIETVEFQQNEMSAGLIFGKAGAGSGSRDEAIAARAFGVKEDGPSELWELEPSRLERQEVHIGRSENGCWYACFEKDGKFWYVTGSEDVRQEEFTAYLKKIL